METEINSITSMNDKSIFHLDANYLHVSPFESQESSINNRLEFKSCCFRCLRVFHQFLYYSFAYPYQMIVDKHKGKVYLVSNGFRTAAWAVIQIAIVTTTSYSVANNFTFQKRIAEDPTQLYQVVSTCIWFIAKLAWPYYIITKKDLVQKVISHSFTLDDGLPFLSKCRVDPLLTATVCTLLITWTLIQMTGDIIVIFDTGVFPFGFGIVNNIFEALGTSFWDTLITVCLLANQFIFFWNNWTTFSVGMISCVVINGISKDYLRFIDQWKSKDVRFLKVIGTYKTVKELVGNINRISSLFTFLLIIGMMAWFCDNFTFLIGDRSSTPQGDGWIARVALIWYFLILTFVMALAAKAHNKFQKIDQYILANVGDGFNLESKVEGIILQNENSQNPLGVEAHHFILSYSMMATILSTMLTYIFILLQFQSAAMTREGNPN